MTGSLGQGSDSADQLTEAHQQLLERDQRINELRYQVVELRRENNELRSHLESILTTKVWRTAERLRALRAAIRRR